MTCGDSKRSGGTVAKERGGARRNRADAPVARGIGPRTRRSTYRRRLDAKLDEQLREGRREIDSDDRGAEDQDDRTVAAGGAPCRCQHQHGRGWLRARRRPRRTRTCRRRALKTGTESGRTGGGTYPGAQGPIEPGVQSDGRRPGPRRRRHRGARQARRNRHERASACVRRCGICARSAAQDNAERAPAQVRVSVDLQPREGSLSELNVIGCTVDEAITRVEKFLDESTVSDQQVVRIIHGHGTGQLRRGLAAFLKEHPLVAKFDLAAHESRRWRRDGGGVERLIACNGSLSPAVHRRPETPRRHRRGDSGLRVAEEDRRDLQGTVSVSRGEDAVVSRQPGQGVLPLLRVRRRRRRVQVSRAPREGRLSGCREAAGAAVRHDAPGDGAERRAAGERGGTRDAAQGPRSRRRVVPRAAAVAGRRPGSDARSPSAASPTRRARPWASVLLRPRATR